MSQHKCLQNEAKSGKYHAFRDLDEWWEAVHLLYVIFMQNTKKIFLTRSDQKSSSAPLTCLFLNCDTKDYTLDISKL